MKASGANSRPSWAWEGEDRHKGEGDDHQAQEQGGTDLRGGFGDDFPVLFAGHLAAGVLMLPTLKMLMSVLNHHHGRIDHGADGDGDAAQGHDVGVDALDAHDDEGEQHPERKGEDGHERGAHVPEEEGADERHHEEFLGEFAGEILDRPIDQLRAVIGGDHLDASWQAALELLELVLDGRDGLAGVLARAQDHHAASDLGLAVELGDAAAHLRADLKRGHVAERDRDAASGGAQRDRTEVIQVPQVA